MENTLKDFYRQVTDVIYVHFLWILTSFLGVLITFGAATTALYKVIFQVFKKDEPTQVTKLFFETFVKEFKESTIVWLILILIVTPLIFMTFYAINQTNLFLLVASMVCLYHVVMLFTYVFPIIAIFKSNSIFETLKNTILIQNRHLLTNLKLIGSLAIIILGILYLPNVFILVLIPLYGFLVAFHLKNALNPYVEKLKTSEYKGDDYELFKL
ncbi:YesL family protein [Acholeplasma hippikon]|uniref:Predicted integral membrane protein n=1 Tax=Acholeplasma hippikon TaxID=264636 RepID=A0A449BLL8_9MOLU|nr:YesL family protein [Acholeplasma hippikon]VEU83318.1 Predicted integral membrane protein [Acholeplasma hippikon]